MAPYQLGQFTGALGICFVITSILYAASRSWPKSIGKLVFINSIAAIFSVLMSAVGYAISAEATPSFGVAPFYLAAQAVIAAVDFYRLRRRIQRDRIVPERTEPRF